MHGNLNPHESASQQHRDQFMRFCTAHPCAQHTDRQTDINTQTMLHGTLAAMGCIYALHAVDAAWTLCEWRVSDVHVCVHVTDTYGQSSSSRDRTLDRRLLRLRWTPEHSMQTSAPKLRLAQSGPSDMHTIIMASLQRWSTLIVAEGLLQYSTEVVRLTRGKGDKTTTLSQ